MSRKTSPGTSARPFSWVCPQCDTRNTGDVCTACGRARAVAAVEKKTGSAVKWVVLIMVLALIISGAGAAFTLLPPYLRYQDALALTQAGNHGDAYLAFVDMGDYRDSPEQARQALEQWRAAMREQGQYAQALQWLAQNAPDEEAALAPEFHYLYGMALGSAQEPDYAQAYQELLAAGDYEDAREQADELALTWCTALLDDPSVPRANSFSQTVMLNAAQSRTIFELLCREIYEKEVSGSGATFYYTEQDTAVRNILLDQLVGSYPHEEELGLLFEQLNMAWPQDFVREHPEVIEALWDYPIGIDLASHDDCIYIWMLGTWRTENRQYYLRFYEKESDPDSVYSHHNLPFVSKPAGTAYWSITDSVYAWVDEDLNELAKVYRFTLIDPDTVQVYCYKNDKTYTLYRDE